MYFIEERGGEQEWQAKEFVQGGEWDVHRHEVLV